MLSIIIIVCVSAALAYLLRVSLKKTEGRETTVHAITSFKEEAKEEKEECECSDCVCCVEDEVTVIWTVPEVEAPAVEAPAEGPVKEEPKHIEEAPKAELPLRKVSKSIKAAKKVAKKKGKKK